MAMGMLEIRKVDKFYHSRGKAPVHAVRSLDMEIGKGEIVALLGSSGCGKTSTLRMIAGFESVTAGSIPLEGRRIPEPPQVRDGLGGLLALSAANGAREHRVCAKIPAIVARGNVAARRCHRAPGRD